MYSLDDLTLDNMLEPRVYTGRRGRPRGTGKRDGQHLYDICKVLAANPGMAAADAIRHVVTDDRDYNRVDRITRKLNKHPSLLKQAVEHHEASVQRVLNGAHSSIFLHMNLRTRRQFDAYFSSRFMLEFEVLGDPRVKECADKIWKKIRPHAAIEEQFELLVRRQDEFSRMVREATVFSYAVEEARRYERELSRYAAEIKQMERLAAKTIHVDHLYLAAMRYN